jgi:adenosylhomocysteine nucleosidase
VVGSAYLQHDMDASPIFPKYEAPGYQRSRFAADAQLLAIILEAACAMNTRAIGQFGLKNGSKNDSQPTIHQGLIISGDRFVSTTAESAALQAALPDALCVEMEGAAVAQVCCDYALPFVAVRSISDRADDNAHHDFPQFLRTVAAPLSQALVCQLMKLLPKL